jgi:hypothetical protein
MEEFPAVFLLVLEAAGSFASLRMSDFLNYAAKSSSG